jgi:hypothetical protein
MIYHAPVRQGISNQQTTAPFSLLTKTEIQRERSYNKKLIRASIYNWHSHFFTTFVLLSFVWFRKYQFRDLHVLRRFYLYFLVISINFLSPVGVLDAFSGETISFPFENSVVFTIGSDNPAG